MRSKLLSLLAALAFALPLSGQGAGMMAEQTVDWTVDSEEISPDVYRVTLTGTILPGYHIYDTHDKYSGTELTLSMKRLRPRTASSSAAPCSISMS